MPRLMHPQHGWHVTSAGDDIEAMRRAGWVDDDGFALVKKLWKKSGPATSAAIDAAWAAAEVAGAARLAAAGNAADAAPRRRKSKG